MRHISYDGVGSHYGYNAFLGGRGHLEGIITAFPARDAHNFTAAKEPG
jgi:hypothetical protein